MSMSQPPKPPYIDWRLDAWKIGAILLIFAALLAGVFWENGPVGSLLQRPVVIAPHATDNGGELLPLVGVQTSIPDPPPDPTQPSPSPTPFGAGLLGATATPSSPEPPLSEPAAPEPVEPEPEPSAPEDEVIEPDLDEPELDEPELDEVASAPEDEDEVEPVPEPNGPALEEPGAEEMAQEIQDDEAGQIENGVEDEGDPEPIVDETSEPLDPLDAGLNLPLTISNIAPNSIAPPGTVARLEGTGAAGAQIEVRVQHVNVSTSPGLLPISEPEAVVGSVEVDPEGRWRLMPNPPLQVGQNVITLRQYNGQGVLNAVSSPVVVNVLDSGTEGPLSLVTPVIRFPVVGSDVVEGGVEFRGTGLPGIQVRLYVDNRVLGEAYVGTLEEWHITPQEALSPGVYVARVAALNPQGEIMAESAPVAFIVRESPLGMQESPPGGPTVALHVTDIGPLATRSGEDQSIVLNGRATPHSSVALFCEETPCGFATVWVDGTWRLILDAKHPLPASLRVVSSLGEQVAVDGAGRGMAGTGIEPSITSPVAGAEIGQNPPAIVGSAQPGERVYVGVDGRVIARLHADRFGRWACKPIAPLAAGERSIWVSTTTEIAADGVITVTVH